MEEVEKSFVVTLYKIFTEKHSLVINLPTIKEIYKYFISHNISLTTQASPLKCVKHGSTVETQASIITKPQTLVEILNNVGAELSSRKTPENGVVLFEEFRDIADKILGIRSTTQVEGLIHESKKLQVFSVKTEPSSVSSTDHGDSDNLMQVKSILKSYKPGHTRNKLNTLKITVEMSPDKENIIDSSGSLSLCENNFSISTLHEIEQRCIVNCLYVFQIMFSEENEKLKIFAKILPYLLSNVKINESCDINNTQRNEFLTINLLSNEKVDIINSAVSNECLTINSKNLNKNSFNIVTKAFIKGHILSMNESILCKSGHISLFVSRLDVLQLSPYTQMVDMGEEERLQFFIENLVLKSFVPLVNGVAPLQKHLQPTGFKEKNNIEEFTDGGINKHANKVNLCWFVLYPELDVSFTFDLTVNGVCYTVSAAILSEHFEYKIDFSGKLTIKRGIFVSYFE
ncbi:hypothetical protein CDIK_1523 [Cucumispora dikerogammari]|nr:hypothetical protein CDIK_1523 [Cucumispora dikerogammari]